MHVYIHHINYITIIASLSENWSLFALRSMYEDLQRPTLYCFID